MAEKAVISTGNADARPPESTVDFTALLLSPDVNTFALVTLNFNLIKNCAFGDLRI